MKKIFLCGFLMCLCYCTSVTAQQKNDPEVFNALLKRIVQNHSNEFSAEIVSSVGGEDFFELGHKGNKILLRGNNNNSLSVGLNYYLKFYCHTSVSWYADDPVEMPNVLPVVLTSIKKTAKVKNRFFLNYCTFGYTMPWWQWKDWERFIDWMALNGINMPLATTGEESIYYKVWNKLGLSDHQIRNYFTGPAHLPWNRMSNIDHLQGPLPSFYIDDQMKLQKKIVQRERELDMKPVLPAFAGHVPAAIANYFPHAKLTKMEWGAFGDEYCASFLDPLDSLFPKIQRLFLEEQTKAYGTDHIYGADPFNELPLPRTDTAYLAQVSRTIYESMQGYDSNATWMMMTWVFYFERKLWTNERIKAFQEAVPKDKLLLLDYYCENTELWKLTDSYFQYPYVWCYLGNFGGNTMLAGNLVEVNNRIDYAFQYGGNNLSGIGSTLEAFDVNPMMYEFVFEKAWNDSSVSPVDWINAWADRRSGKYSSSARDAWQILLDKVYQYPALLGQATLTNARPTITGNGNWTTSPHIDYSNKDLWLAWDKLVSATGVWKDSYEFDVVNIGRQVLGNYFLALRDSFSLAYQKKNVPSLKKYGKDMLMVMDDLDQLLASNRNFLLGKWIADAEKFGTNTDEKQYYSQNAKTILTIWGKKNHSLNDYANRTWAGLTKTFYRKRWEMFINDVMEAALSGEAFDPDRFHQKVTEFELEWTKQTYSFSPQPAGNVKYISNRILKKYATAIGKQKKL